MSTEELPDDLDKLKITQKITQNNKLRDRNPFYSPNTNSNAEFENGDNAGQNIKQKAGRVRRRSTDDGGDTITIHPVILALDQTEMLNPLRVHKQQLKRSNATGSKRVLLREPILCMSGNLNNCRALDEKSRTNFHKPRNNNNISIKSSINNICSFRELIGECNILLDQSKSKGIVNLSKNFTIWQKAGSARAANGIGTGLQSEYIEPNRDRTIINSNSARLSCSQEASNNISAANSRNGDDVSIVELASYFDTIVHIPKKMSSMAEMMYI